jgi:spore coat protein CotF
MDAKHNTKLTGPEITSLWTQYQSDSLNLCVNTYMYNTLDAESDDIKSIFKEAIATSKNNLIEIENLLNQEGYPIPQGFTDHDVHVDAPKLYSDGLSLKYLHEMTIHGLSAYSLAMTISTRKDMREFYQDKIHDCISLYNQTIELLLSKGIYHRPPYIPAPVGIDFIKTESFFEGVLGDKRTLNGSEISNIFFNLKKSIVTKAIIIGFNQVTTSKDVRKILTKGMEIKHKHIDLFVQILMKDNLPAPQSWDSDVTDSIIPPFSDKLMMYMTGFLFSTAISYYGAGLGSTMRSDLILQYEKFILEDLKYVEDWTDLMLKYQWLEQPPKAPDRKKLAEE